LGFGYCFAIVAKQLIHVQVMAKWKTVSAISRDMESFHLITYRERLKATLNAQFSNYLVQTLLLWSKKRDQQKRAIAFSTQLEGINANCCVVLLRRLPE